MIEQQCINAFAGIFPGIAKHHAPCIVPPGNLDTAFDRIRFNPIVAVYEKDILTGSGLEASFSGKRRALIFLMYDPDALIVSCMRIAQRRAFIGASVVHQNYFQVGIALRTEALHALAQIFFCFIDRYDNRNLWKSRKRCEAGYRKMKSSICTPQKNKEKQKKIGSGVQNREK